MFFFDKQYSIGLDIGQNIVKTVLLKRQGRTIIPIDYDILDCRAEAILDERELYQELRSRLYRRGWHRYEVVANIPQYVASIQVTDFPPGHRNSLEEMVAYETSQLAGMSEDAFTDDYQRMPSVRGRDNPVILGICKESVTSGQALNLIRNGLKLSDLAITGTALASAYFEFYPENVEEGSLQLLVDIGAENTTVVIVSGRSVIYTASLMCGTERYVQILARDLNVTKERAEEIKQAPADRDSHQQEVCNKALAIFGDELSGILEQWRDDEKKELAELDFSALYISGGGVYIDGLREYLGEIMGCKAEILSVPRTGSMSGNPLTAVSYGLALQGLKAAPISLSLAPAFVQKQVQRVRRFPFLAATVVVFAGLIVSAELRSFVNFQNKNEQLSTEARSFQKAEQMVPELRSLKTDIKRTKEKTLPLFEKARHVHLTRDVIKGLGEVRKRLYGSGANEQEKAEKDVLTVYLADSAAFHGQKPQRAKEGRNSAFAATDIEQSLFQSESGSQQQVGGEDSKEPAEKIYVDDLSHWADIVCGLFVKAESDERYAAVRDVIRELSELELFSQVDIMPGPQWTGREDIFRPWLESTDSGVLKDYHRFHIVMSIAESYKVQNQKTN